MKHLLNIRLMPTETILELLALAEAHRNAVHEGKKIEAPTRKSIGLLFFEGSTRTRVSFEQAAYYLGFHYTNFSSSGSSLAKGETLKDTILTLKNERLDALIMRHGANGSPNLAAHYFGGPVINAGDGKHEHPTQALGDALTVLSHKGTIKGLTIAIVGDVLHSRVARSNAWLFHKLGADVRFVGPKMLMPSSTALMPGNVYFDLPSGIKGADVVMGLRLQKERMDDGLLSSVGEYRRLYQINSRTIKYAKPDAIVMHPGPMNRGVELDDAMADGPQSVIGEQVESCLFVRTAALQWVFDDAAPPKPKRGKSK